MRSILGLDLGQQTDFTAAALLRCPVPAPGQLADYQCPLLKRWPLATKYSDIAADLVKLLRLPDLFGTLLAVDATGVGRPVVEMIAGELRQQKVRALLLSVTITAGSAVTLAGDGEWRVAKKELVSVLSTVVHSERLHVARDLPEAAVLLREMGTFKVKINTATASESFEAWRERDHDDLVLAVALAAWAGERLNWSAPEEAPTRLVAG